MVEVAGWERAGIQDATGCEALTTRLQSSQRVEKLSAALAAMEAAYEGKAVSLSGLIPGLLSLLGVPGPESFAATWALVWLSGGWGRVERTALWTPSGPESQKLVNALANAPAEDYQVRRSLIHILGNKPNQEALKSIVSSLGDPNADVRASAVEVLPRLGAKRILPLLRCELSSPNSVVRSGAVEALGQLRDEQTTPLLITQLDDPDAAVRRMAVEGLGQSGGEKAILVLPSKLDDSDSEVRQSAVGTLVKLCNKEGSQIRLLSRDVDGQYPWVDPVEPITEERLAVAAEALATTIEEVRSLYSSIAAEFHLRFDG
jgi:HEAT repeat protein